jgi:predicted DNA-binding WGR domain protein
MKKYYLMAVEKDHSNVMCNLGNYYHEQKDYDNMKKYYLMAINKDNMRALKALNEYYKNI